MTAAELTTLVTFLTCGGLVGIAGRWADLVISYVQGRG